MSETKPSGTPVTTPSTTSSLDWKKAEERVEQITKHLKNFEGKPGFNSYMYYNKYVQPLVDRYAKNERTPELHKAMCELKLEEPTLDKVPQPIPGVVSIDKLGKK